MKPKPAVSTKTLEDTLEDKMMKLKSLSDAILRAKKTFQEKPDYFTAAAVQRLERQRAELRGTLPRLNVVVDNT